MHFKNAPSGSGPSSAKRRRGSIHPPAPLPPSLLTPILPGPRTLAPCRVIVIGIPDIVRLHLSIHLRLGEAHIPHRRVTIGGLHGAHHLGLAPDRGTLAARDYRRFRSLFPFSCWHCK